MSSLRLTTLVLLAVPALAQAELVEIAWGADGRVALEREVPAGKFVELCGPLAKGQQLRWSYSAGAPLDFNIHYHLGKEVVYPVQLRQTARATDRLAVAVAQDYCWMWVNKTAAPVQLSAELRK